MSDVAQSGPPDPRLGGAAPQSSPPEAGPAESADATGPPGAGEGQEPAEAAGRPAEGPEPAADASGRGPVPDAGSVTTRARILDVALDLFIDQGFDGTSLREIAQRLGLTKAALYYYFTSKDDILMALHMRLHEFGRDALAAMGDEPVTLDTWGKLLDELVDHMITQRKIFALHQRNPAALEKLHRQVHRDDHEDIQARFRTVLADARLPLRDRFRMAASFGVLLGGLFLPGDAFSSASNRELGVMARDAIWDVLRG